MWLAPYTRRVRTTGAYRNPEVPRIWGPEADLRYKDLETYDAERHLVLGTKDSPETLALLEYSWYLADESHTAPLYAARGIIPYLLLGNLRAANKFSLIFTSKLQQKANLGVQEVTTTS